MNRTKGRALRGKNEAYKQWFYKGLQKKVPDTFISFDLQSAKDAGAIPVLIRTHSSADDFAHLADFTIDRLDEILTIIDSK